MLRMDRSSVRLQVLAEPKTGHWPGQVQEIVQSTKNRASQPLLVRIQEQQPLSVSPAVEAALMIAPASYVLVDLLPADERPPKEHRGEMLEMTEG